MNALKHITLAAMLAAATGASAQTEKMVVYLSDGTTQAIPTAEIDHVEFATAAAPTDKPISIALNEAHALHAYITATAPASVGTYMVMYDTKQTYDSYANEAAVVADDVNYLTQYASYYGSTLAAVLKNILVSGTSKQLITGILPGTAYTVWAYGMDTSATQTTGLTTFTFTAPAVEKISNTIDVVIGQGSDGYPTATFTPDDATLYYVSGSISSQYSDEQIEAAINSSMSNGIGNYLQQSQTVDAAIADLCDKGNVTNTLSNRNTTPWPPTSTPTVPCAPPSSSRSIRATRAPRQSPRSPLRRARSCATSSW